ncbi:MAG: hypothetical protein KDD64_14005 [Bdellovibrionales bacterium]|nr:hypothetical protein [Bdellovibrionales bacterium]
MRTFQSTAIVFLGLLFAHPIPRLHAQIDPNEFVSSVAVAAALNSTNTEIADLDNKKRQLTDLLRSLGGKKNTKGKGLLQRAKEDLSELKVFRRSFSKLEDKILKKELLGQPVGKLRKQFIKLVVRFNRQAGKSDRTLERIAVFVVANTVVPANFRGSWDTNFGRISFAQFDDNFVTGNYSYNGGGIARGTVNGSVLRGTYIANNGGEGTFKIVMAEDGKSWAGSYRSNNGNTGGAWRATKS